MTALLVIPSDPRLSQAVDDADVPTGDHGPGDPPPAPSVARRSADKDTEGDGGHDPGDPPPVLATAHVEEEGCGDGGHDPNDPLPVL